MCGAGRPTGGGGGKAGDGGGSSKAAEYLAKNLAAQGSNNLWSRSVGADRRLHWERNMDASEEKEMQGAIDECKAFDHNEVAGLPVRVLKDVLRDLDVSHTGAVEKDHLVEMLMKRVDEVNSMPVKTLRGMLIGLGHEDEQKNCVEKQQLVTLYLRNIASAAVSRHRDDINAGGWICDLEEGADMGWYEAMGRPVDMHMSGATAKLTAEDLRKMSGAPFATKLEWFRQHVAHMRVPWDRGHVKVRVRRSQLLETAFEQFSQLKAEDMRRIFRFEFIGEPGLDAGGVAREWFQVVSDALFNADFGLFSYSSGDNLCYQLNPSSGVANELHLQYFFFAGRVIGKAIFDKQICPPHFVAPIYKCMLKWPITISDLDFLDPAVSANLQGVAKMDDVEELYLDFTTTTTAFGETKVVELVEGGADVDLTNENRHEYIQLMLKHMILDKVNPQLAQFLRGLYDVIPHPLLSVFDFKELELVICGLPTIDVQDWFHNTNYAGVFADKAKAGGRHDVIQWFWEFVESLSEEQRARMLQFVTGTSRVPVQGFAALQGYDGNLRKFCVDSLPKSKGLLPHAHTCFNRIDLPVYKSKEDLEKYVNMAISMELTGFGQD